MNDTTPEGDPKNKGRAIFDEVDIGSGERSPGQQETEELIRGIPALPPSNGDNKEEEGPEKNKRQESGA